MNPDRDTSRGGAMSLCSATLVAGLGLLVMAVLAAFSNFYVLQNIVVPGDAAKTAANIIASAGLFRIAICCFLIVAVLDVVVAWALYLLLKPANRDLSLLAAWFRVVYAGYCSPLALTNLLTVLQLLTGADLFRGAWSESVVCSGNAISGRI